MRMHHSGCVGVPSALSTLFTAYVLEVTDTRPHKVAEAEFLRFTEGAALLIAATSPSDPWQKIGTARSDNGEGNESPPIPQRTGHHGVRSISQICLTASVSHCCQACLSDPMGSAYFTRA